MPPDRYQRDQPVVVARSQLQAHLQEVGGQDGGGNVSPLDQRHAALVEQLGQRQVDDLLEVVEAVHVGVDEREPALVGAHQGEGGARHLLFDAQTPPEALGEDRLAGAQLPRQQDDVSRLRQTGHGGRQLPRVVR